MANHAATTLCKPRFMKLVVDNIDEAVRFYTDAFGMEKTETIDLDPLIEVFVELPDSDFALILVQYKHEPALQNGNAWGPIGFETTDLDASLARVLAAGATVKYPEGTINSLRYVIVESPQGHEIELIQPIEAA